jgi:DNA-binding SARP family transcriptional activator/predicted ATPase/Tfp pilus assembly protein PilF
MQVTLNGEPLTAFRSDKERALLAYLALEGDRPHRREALANLLWGDLPEEAALGNLRKVLHHLRQVLDEEDSLTPFLAVTAKTIQFNTASQAGMDVAEFEQAWAKAERHRHRRPETCQLCRGWLEGAVTLYRGDLLQGFNLPDAIAFDEWLLVRREQLRQKALSALQQVAESYERKGEMDKAGAYARQQVLLEPWRETAQRQLMRVLARSGQRAAALAQYEACQQALREELGVEPEAATLALYEKIKRGEALEPGWETVRGGGVGLPVQTTPFFGREKELDRLSERLRDPAERLLTLVAVGGMGKTRLALKAAEGLADDFEDGAWFVPLAGIGTLVEVGEAEAALVRALASSLRISLASGGEPKTQVLNFLQSRECLLILDNFEHLLEAAGLVLDILREAPSATVLVTSRERLNLQAERLIFLDGLALPPFDAQAEIGAYSAVQLFVERAERSAGQVTLTGEDGEAVVAVCRMLDGLPLGIELAAATVRVTPPMALAQSLRGNIELLATSMRDLPSRHRSLKAVFEQSWALLNANERRVLARVAIFVGGFTAEAAKVVVDATTAQLDALVEKSLLRQLPSGRFEMHEMWRQLAADKLTAQGDVTTARRHATYYLQYVAAREAALLGLEPQVPLRELRLEIDNIREGWRVAVAEKAWQTLAQSGEGLALFYDYEGLLNEGAEQIGEAVRRLQLEGGTLPELAQLQAAWALFLRRLDRHDAAVQAAQAAALWAKQVGTIHIEARARLQWGMALWQHSDYEEAKPQLEAAQTFAQAANLPSVEGRALRALGGVNDLLGQYGPARIYFERALEVFVKAGNRQGECEALHNLGNVAWSLGDLILSRDYHARCLQIARAVGNRQDECDALHNLGNAYQTLGDYAGAQKFFEQSLKVTREAGLPESALSITLSNLGLTMWHLNQNALACEYGEQALALAREAGLRREEALALNCLGHAWASRQQLDSAEEAYRRALALHRDLQQYNLAMESLAGLARCALAHDDRARALSWTEMILTHLVQGNLEGTDEPFWVYLTCYKTLKANNDRRATPLLQQTRTQLLEQADKIGQTEAREIYLNRNEIHREILALT